MRKKDPKYWIKKLQKTIDINNNHGIISVVPDIRFVNEADWLKDNGGILAHLKRDGIVPADKNEERNDSLLREASDFAIDWKSFTEQQDSEKENIVKNFINEVTKN